MLGRLLVGTITCGSIFKSAFSRSFIAYFAKSALLEYGDWAKAVEAVNVEMADTAAHAKNPITAAMGTFIPAGIYRASDDASSRFCRSVRFLLWSDADVQNRVADMKIFTINLSKASPVPSMRLRDKRNAFAA